VVSCEYRAARSDFSERETPGDLTTGARNTSEWFKIWEADALLSSIDWIAADDSVPGSSERVADSVSAAAGDNGDRSVARPLGCLSFRLPLKLRLTSWLGRRRARLASILRRTSQLLRGTSVLERADKSLMLDLPTRGAGSGERVARTFSVICGASPGV
jgi:hypothetical protein